MLLLTCRVLLQFTDQAYIPGLKELQLTERASQSSPHQPGSLFSLQTRRAQSFWLLKNLRTTQPLSQKAKCPWEMGFFPKPSHMSKIKPEFCNLGGERIASFVLFLAKCKSSHSFLSSLQPWHTLRAQLTDSSCLSRSLQSLCHSVSFMLNFLADMS